MRDLDGKVAVVTGGASGIGRALAECFAGEGMRLVLADVEEAALARTSAELAQAGAAVEAVPTDVRDAAALRTLAEKALSAFGDVHVVCNNAGVAPIGTILETSPEDWQWLLDVNVMGVVHGCAVFAPLLVERGRGHIVNTASAGALVPAPGLGAYCATKHAVLALSETLYHELDGTGVDVSVLCPAVVRTGIFSSERNRPAELGVARGYGERQRAAQALIESQGHPPEGVARAVLDAIHGERLYVLPHDEVGPWAERRYRTLLSGENPRRGVPGLPEA